jgi:ABC-2 type transport system ATP-binding protein
VSALPQENAPLVEVRQLTLRFGQVTAVNGVSLSVAKGEVLALIGPDGAGKTSLLRAMAGLLPPTSGEVRVAGLPAWRQRRSLRRLLGYLPQNFALYGDLSVEENLAFFGRLWGLSQWPQRREELLHRLGLAAFRKRRAEALSGGMKQKLALAVALLHFPQLLLLDEPTTGVDPITRREFWRLLQPLLAEGLTLVWATPYLDEAQRASRVLLMHQGGILAQGPPEKLSKSIPAKLLMAEGHPRQALLAALAKLPGLFNLQPFGAGFHALWPADAPVPSPTPLRQQGIEIRRWEVAEPSLEDVFLFLLQNPPGGGA